MAIVTVTATGLGVATAPDNFTVSIVNYLDVVRQYATNVSRASLISGYNVTVQPGDVYVRVTSTGVCTYGTQIDVSAGALQEYRPEEIEQFTFFGSPDSLAINMGDVQYIMGEFDSYTFIDELDFSVEHVSTTGAGGLNTTYGPFLDLGVIPHPTTPGMFQIEGYTRNSYVTDTTVNTTIYRVTYLPSGLSREFNYYWAVNI